MEKPVITRREGGEYSTVLLPGGVVETTWFDDDGSSRVVSRTVLRSVESIAREHIALDSRL